MNGGRSAIQGGYGDEARTQGEWASAGVSSFVRLASAPQQRRRATPFVGPAAADTESNDEKRKARYQPNSAQVQTFYRVNRYPHEVREKQSC